jgi:hypothetical protein
MSEFLVEKRWAATALWLLLHSLDYYLTLWSIRLHRAGADRSFDVGGSLELNPVMRGALERRSPISWRFVIALVGVAAILWWTWEPLREEPDVWAFLVGSLLFTRVSVIGHHVHNIAFLRAILDGRVKGRIEYERGTALTLSFLRYGAEAVALGVAAWLSRSAWLVGGAVTLGALAVVIGARAAWLRLRR